MSFLVYDLVLLGIFVIFLGIFLFRKRHNLKREGLLLLYKTSWGIKLIDRVGEKHRKALNVLSYVSVSVGYLLMAAAFYLIGRVVWIYVFQPAIVKAVQIPPITPLIPYIDKLAPSLHLPSFYFTYWIIIIAVVAILHEFSHGIFAAKAKVKIKSTGFGFFPFFLPIFLAAFVEPDEEQMPRKKIFDQLAVLSAGTFANLITAIVAFGILVGFFVLTFAPAGVSFDTYPYTTINISSITGVGNVSLANPNYEQVLGSMNATGWNEVETTSGNFLLTKSLAEQQKVSGQLIAYYDAPAIKANLEGVILSIDGQKVGSLDQLGNELHKYSPGQSINITVLGNESSYNRTITLGANPGNLSESWLGVAFSNDAGGVRKYFAALSPLNIGENTYVQIGSTVYVSKIGDLAVFLYNLIWWLFLIAASVAVLNMLPMGIFDGGRFFYLTVLAITKKEKVAMWSYRIMTYLFLAVLAVVMFFWIWYVK